MAKTGRPVLVLCALAFLSCACRTICREREFALSPDEEAILQIVADYPRAWVVGDPDLWEGLFWAEDPSFSIIENDRPGVMGRSYIENLGSLIRKRGKQPSNQRWYETRVHVLDEQNAYSVSLRNELNTGKTSRVTFVYRKKNGEWRIIHGHFSFVP